MLEDTNSLDGAQMIINSTSFSQLLVFCYIQDIARRSILFFMDFFFFFFYSLSFMDILKEGAIDKRLSIAISRRNRYLQTFVNSEYALKSLLTNVCQ